AATMSTLEIAQRRGRNECAIVRDKADGTDARVVKYRGGQRSAIDGAGIDIETIRQELDLATRKRRMPVDDVLPVVALIGQKGLANPQEHVLLLLLEWDARLDTRMDEEAPAIADCEGKTLEPRKMLVRKRVRMVDAVAVERFMAPILEPQHLVPALGSADHHLLVVSTQANTLLRRGRLQPDQQLHDGSAFWAAIDIVTDKDEVGFARAAMRRAMLE